MRTNKLTVMGRFLIAEEAVQVNNVKATERKHKVHTSQIHRWKQIMPIQNENSEVFRKKIKIGSGKNLPIPKRKAIVD